MVPNNIESDGAVEPVTEPRDVVHTVELGVEWLRRAQGSLLDFHHQVGNGMDRLAEAERALRQRGYTDLADELRDEILPRGVYGECWSYDVVEAYEDEFMSGLGTFRNAVRDELVGGKRHPYERELEQRRRQRARE